MSCAISAWFLATSHFRGPDCIVPFSDIIKKGVTSLRSSLDHYAHIHEQLTAILVERR